MGLDVFWLLGLGVALGGWSVLDGANLGLGMSLRAVGRTGVERRHVLTALGPFLLAGEVWLVASAGLLIGAFPVVEKDLFHAFYPIIVTLVIAWVLRDAGVWFRSRRASGRWRSAWEFVSATASGVVAFAWGMLLGNVIEGVPTGARADLATLVAPYPLLWGVTVVAVFALHGAVFTALRVPRDLRDRAMSVARGHARPALALAGATWVAGFFLADGVLQPWPAAGFGLLGVVTIALAGHQVRRGRAGRAFVATATAALTPVVAAGTAVAPDLLAGAAGQSALETLTRLLLPVVPVLFAAQAWLWWTFRHRVGPRSAVFF